MSKCWAVNWVCDPSFFTKVTRLNSYKAVVKTCVGMWNGRLKRRNVVTIFCYRWHHILASVTFSISKVIHVIVTLFFSTLLHVSGSHYCYWNLQKYILKILVPFCFLWMQTNMTLRRRNRSDDSKCVQSQLCLTLKILTNHL